MRLSSFVSRVLMTVLVLTAACSTDSAQGGAQLSLVIGNTDVRSVQYDIVCQGGATFSDEFEVVDDRDPPVWETFVGLPAGENCVITLTAFNDAGNPICTGSTSVDIVEGQTVKADITLQCPTTGQIGTGNVNIDGRFEDVIVDICPIIHILNAIPRVMTEPPGESSLRIQASDPDGGAVATVLSSTSGVIADPTAASTMFSCTQAGLVEVTATAADGDPNCEQRVTITLTCPDTCVGVAPCACDDVDCDDGKECTDDGCAAGVCSNVNAPDGTTCTGGSCQSGVCVPDNPCDGVVCGPTGNECTSASCNPSNDQCDIIDPVADGSPCTGGSCQSGICVLSNPCIGKVCPPTGNQCTVALCNSLTGECDIIDPVADDTACVGGTCQAGVCEAQNLCADAATRCNDGDACTTDSCNSTTGACSNLTVADGTPCTGGTCQAGVCEAPNLCADAATRCNDGNACTTDSCNSTTGACSSLSVADGTPCTGGTCQAGVCEAQNLCADAVTRCNDGDECTADSCNSTTGACSNLTVADGTSCTGGTCQAGVCEPAVDLCADAATRCNDGIDCTVDNCDAATGACFATDAPDGTACAVVGGIGQCNSILGTVSPPLCIATLQCAGEGTCNDLNPCTTDVCSGSPNYQCSNTNKPAGTSCSLGPLAPGTCNASGVCIAN